MLEGAKLAPIYERKRKQVMQRLLELQGEGRKDVADVPSLSSVDDQSVEEELASVSTEESPARKRHSQISSGEDEDGSKLVRRNSKLLGLMSKFEQPDENKSNFKYKTLEQLKNKQSEPTEEEEEEVEEEEASPVPEEPADVEELAEEDEEQPTAAAEEKSRTKGRFGKFKKLFKSKDKDKPYAPVEIEQSGESQEELLKDKEGEEEEANEVDSDIRLTAQLDRVTKRLGSTHHQRVYVTLRSTTLTVAKNVKGEDAREIALAGTSVSAKDSVHFEFHCDKKGLVFRTDSEDTCQQWVEAIQTAITECSPEQPADSKSSTHITHSMCLAKGAYIGWCDVCISVWLYSQCSTNNYV